MDKILLIKQVFFGKVEVLKKSSRRIIVLQVTPLASLEFELGGDIVKAAEAKVSNQRVCNTKRITYLSFTQKMMCLRSTQTDSEVM